jgi:hypothetical protein
MRSRSQGEEGAVAVLVAIMLVVLLGVLALTIDLGLLRDERTHAQNAADNAALSAAYAYCLALAGSPPRTHAEAVSTGTSEGTRIATAGENGYAASQVTITPPTMDVNHDWTVTIQTSSATYFAPAVVDGVGAALATGALAGATCDPGFASSPPLPALWAGGSCGDKTILLNGSKTVINGDVHSNDQIQVGGSSMKVNGRGTYVTSIKDNLPAKITWNPADSNPTATTTKTDPTGFPYVYADFLAGGKYHKLGNNKDHIFSWPPPATQVSGSRLKPGIYVTAGTIDLGSYAGGDNVTFISKGDQEPSIKFSRSGSAATPLTYTPFLDGFLAISFRSSSCDSGFGIDISGQHVNLDGTFYSPNSGIKWQGSSGFGGPLIGKYLTISGSDDVIKGGSPGTATSDPKVTLGK